MSLSMVACCGVVDHELLHIDSTSYRFKPRAMRYNTYHVFQALPRHHFVVSKRCEYRHI
jgi:hypothetical protein